MLHSGSTVGCHSLLKYICTLLNLVFTQLFLGGIRLCFFLQWKASCMQSFYLSSIKASKNQIFFNPWTCEANLLGCHLVSS